MTHLWLCRSNAPDQDAALTESLLHPEGLDIEAPAQILNPNAPQKRKRPWTSLLGTALVYVWPHNRVLQVLDKLASLALQWCKQGVIRCTFQALTACLLFDVAC